jgi:hypothetical protein
MESITQMDKRDKNGPSTYARCNRDAGWSVIAYKNYRR